jgi:hypothetical protein
MNRFLTRIVAFILVPCLAIDPVMASIGPVGAGLVPARNNGRDRHDGLNRDGGQAQDLPLQFPFASQAVAPPGETNGSPPSKTSTITLARIIAALTPHPSKRGRRPLPWFKSLEELEQKAVQAWKKLLDEADDETLEAYVEWCADSGHLEEGEVAITHIKDHAAKAHALAYMVTGYARAGSVLHASASLHDSVTLIREFSGFVPLQVEAMCLLGMRVADLDRPELNAEELFAEAQEMAAGKIGLRLFVELARQRAGLPNKARAILDRWESLLKEDPEMVGHDDALIIFMEAAYLFDNLPLVDQLLKAIIDPVKSIRGQAVRARLEALNPPMPYAARWFEKITPQIDGLRDEWSKNDARKIVALEMTRAHVIQGAKNVARQILDPETKARAMRAIEREKARITVARNPPTHRQPNQIKVIAPVEPAAPPEADESLETWLKTREQQAPVGPLVVKVVGIGEVLVRMPDELDFDPDGESIGAEAVVGRRLDYLLKYVFRNDRHALNELNNGVIINGRWVAAADIQRIHIKPGDVYELVPNRTADPPLLAGVPNLASAPDRNYDKTFSPAAAQQFFDTLKRLASKCLLPDVGIQGGRFVLGTRPTRTPVTTEGNDRLPWEVEMALQQSSLDSLTVAKDVIEHHSKNTRDVLQHLPGIFAWAEQEGKSDADKKVRLHLVWDQIGITILLHPRGRALTMGKRRGEEPRRFSVTLRPEWLDPLLPSDITLSNDHFMMPPERRHERGYLRATSSFPNRGA